MKSRNGMNQCPWGGDYNPQVTNSRHLNLTQLMRDYFGMSEQTPAQDSPDNPDQEKYTALDGLVIT